MNEIRETLLEMTKGDTFYLGCELVDFDGTDLTAAYFTVKAQKEDAAPRPSAGQEPHQKGDHEDVGGGEEGGVWHSGQALSHNLGVEAQKQEHPGAASVQEQSAGGAENAGKEGQEDHGGAKKKADGEDQVRGKPQVQGLLGGHKAASPDQGYQKKHACGAAARESVHINRLRKTQRKHVEACHVPGSGAGMIANQAGLRKGRAAGKTGKKHGIGQLQMPCLFAIILLSRKKGQTCVSACPHLSGRLLKEDDI